MKKIPKESLFTAIPTFRKEGYEFISNRSRKHNSDIFQLRLFLKKVICVTGAEAAEMFYDPDKFERKGAIPKRIQKSLTGKNAIQTTDAEIHRERKSMFMSMMTPEKIEALTDLTAENWDLYLKKWRKKRNLLLFKEVPEILCRSICCWTGVPLKEKNVSKRSQDLIAMVDAFGAVGPRHWRGKRARKRSEKWVSAIVKKYRAGDLKAAADSPLHIVATYRENSELLSDRMAAIELLNLIRPTVAITYYIVFAALALEEHPQYKQRIKEGDEDFTLRFVHEVRRYFPIGPFLGNNAKKDFLWKEYKIPKGALVLLDIYGTNRDPRYWDKPNDFWPDNFLDWSKSPFDFLPQGGGDHYNNHRCAGEWITIENLKLALKVLAQKMTYKVPKQDLSYSLQRIPTYPKSGFRIKV